MLEDAGALLEVLSQVLGLPCHRGLCSNASTVPSGMSPAASGLMPSRTRAGGADKHRDDRYPAGTVQQYEQAAIAREAVDHKEFFEGASPSWEHDAGLPGPDAEIEAARITALEAHRREYVEGPSY